MLKSIAVIPARYSSSRYPGKPLVSIAGKSMIERVYSRAAGVKGVSEVVVATEDERIFKSVRAFGGNVAFTSDKCMNGTERCAEFLRTILPGSYDLVINVQGDEPFIQPDDLEKLLSTFTGNGVQISTLAKRFKDEQQFLNPARVKVITDDTGMALKFTRQYTGLSYLDSNVFQHLGLYAFRTDVLQQIVKLQPTPSEIAENLEQLRWLDNGFSIKCIKSDYESIAVDTPEDLIVAERFAFDNKL